MKHLTTESISATVLKENHRHDDCGSLVSFEGMVRDHHDGKKVAHLVYEAYDSMAEKEISKLIAECGTRWPEAKLLIKHRLGKLHIGDTAVVILVWTPHRAEGFAACRFLIDEIKHRVPIFKKETYTDGTKSWVRCDHHEH